MRIPTTLCAAALAVCAFLTPAVRAQVKAFGGPDDDRKACTLIFADTAGGNFSPKGAVSINYSQPDWKESYNKQLGSGEFNGKNARLGKNWWTSFDTYIPLTVGGTKVAPGNYYLGIHVDEKGAFKLLFLDQKVALTNGWTPFMPEPWKSDIAAPLTLAKDSLKESQSKMVIAITADEKDSTKGKFSVQWGKHELSAPVTFQLPTAKDASAPK
jgi:hypothetical protein